MHQNLKEIVGSESTIKKIKEPPYAKRVEHELKVRKTVSMTHDKMGSENTKASTPPVTHEQIVNIINASSMKTK